MSAKLQPEWIERRANIDPETGARQKRLLVIGEDAEKISSAFARLMPNCHIEAAARADHAVLAMASGHFDATLVDCRSDERFHRLAIVAARQFKSGRVALLASDHFLPDETAVLDNLEIFGSQDDSANLLDSLRLKARKPEPKTPAPHAEEFDAALRAELEGLHSHATPAAGEMPEAEEAARADVPAAEPGLLQSVVSDMTFAAESSENAAQFIEDEAPDLFAELTIGLEEALLGDETLCRS